MITNIQGLHESWVRLAETYWEEYDGRSYWMTDTALIDPPRVVQLTRRHLDQIYVDVSNMHDIILGQMLHEALAKMAMDSDIVEQRFALTYKGKLLGFKPDIATQLEDHTHWIKDYKTAKVWKIVGHYFAGWNQQLNLCAFALSINGKPVSKLTIEYLLKDYDMEGPTRGHSSIPAYVYPKAPIGTHIAPLWSTSFQQDFLRDRCDIHMAAEEVPDDQLPYCTDEERWCRNTRWSVKKVGNKVACKHGSFPTEEQALAFKEAQETKTSKPHEVEFRPGEDTRCEKYCQCRLFCNQYLGTAGGRPLPK